jgi:photosystem II stability/assembly factor-like uncharacterized protein
MARVLAVILAMVVVILACGPTTPTVPFFVYHLSHVDSTFGRGGRAVAVDVDPANSNIAIAGAEQGGLFRTADGGTTWTHLDALPVPNIMDARFVLGDHSGKTLVVTGWVDSHVDNDGGVWVSADSGTTWSHVALPSPCSGPTKGFGIGFDPQSADVLVGTSCGLVISHDVASKGGQASWSMLFPVSTISVVVEPGTLTGRIDACSDGGPNGRGIYVQSGAGTFTFAQPSPGSLTPDCQTVNSVAVSPIASALTATAIFATSGRTVIQSNDGGIHWTDLQADPYNDGRPIWVRTERTTAASFSLYVPGQVESCQSYVDSWSCPINGWTRVPASSLNHDMNDIAFSPAGTCPQIMALDFGVVRGDPPGTTTCTNGSGWQLAGNDAAGFHALQIYDVAGQLNRSVGPNGKITLINTDLYIATQDNHAQFSPDGGVTWQDVAANDEYYLQSPLFTVTGDPDRSGATFVECAPCSAYKVQQTGNALGMVSPWPAHPPIVNGKPDLNGSPPTLLSAGKYVQWSVDLTTLYLTTDDGATWTAVATVPAGYSGPDWLMQVSGGTTATPTIFDQLAGPGGSTALIRISGIRNPSTGAAQMGTAAPLPSSSTQPVLGWYCKESGGNDCPVPYGVDPANANHLITADFKTKQMVVTTDGGQTWQPNTQLTQLLTANGSLSFDTPDSQARVIAFDPLHPNLVLVGTEQAGIIASSDGGQTWVTIPQSQQLVNITSFFFDDLHAVVYVGTFSSGLWRFNFTNQIT